ncbi:hypothetical protein EV356DRAFT_516150 [Viridothelium virens]|uniref:Uncharacterized protein n=1 Tax=Viridothelium virens TaxID=1048519 RepID=A0A6A6H6N2_VIRVR|nr:hypothetical protein EV356DRAFT_516150 [Viridothelium virens]
MYRFIWLIFFTANALAFSPGPWWQDTSFIPRDEPGHRSVCEPIFKSLDDRSNFEPAVGNVSTASETSHGSFSYYIPLVYRAMIQPGPTQKERTQWLKDEFGEEDENPDVAQIVFTDARNGDNVNTAKFYKLGRSPFSVGTRALSGCTCMIISSRKGVYAAHYWESISFAPEDPGEDDLGETILTPLREGVKSNKWFQQPLASAAAQALYGGQAFLMIPSVGVDEKTKDPYRKQWQQIKDTVNEIIREANPDEQGQPITWLPDYAYTPVKDNQNWKFWETARGTLLWKFEPREQDTDPKRLIKA